jgi:hypothetical protein
VTAVRGWSRGPELFWLGVYGLGHLAAIRNEPPTDAGNLLLENLCWQIPAFATPLAFVVFFRLWPSDRRYHVAGRLAFATFIGLNACLFHVIDGIDYGDSRNSGVLGFWVIGVMVGGFSYLMSRVALAVARSRGWAR